MILCRRMARSSSAPSRGQATAHGASRKEEGRGGSSELLLVAKHCFFFQQDRLSKFLPLYTGKGRMAIVNHFCRLFGRNRLHPVIAIGFTDLDAPFRIGIPGGSVLVNGALSVAFHKYGVAPRGPMHRIRQGVATEAYWASTVRERVLRRGGCSGTRMQPYL